MLLGKEVPSFSWNTLPKSSAKKRAFLAGRWQQQVRPKSWYLPTKLTKHMHIWNPQQLIQYTDKPMGRKTEKSWFNPWQRHEIFRLSKASRPALVPIPPTHLLWKEVTSNNGAGMGSTHLHIVLEVKNVWCHTSTPYAFMASRRTSLSRHDLNLVALNIKHSIFVIHLPHVHLWLRDKHFP